MMGVCWLDGFLHFS